MTSTIAQDNMRDLPMKYLVNKTYHWHLILYQGQIYLLLAKIKNALQVRSEIDGDLKY